MPRFEKSDRIQEIASELIPQYHGHLLNNRVAIEYLLDNKDIKDSGRLKWGKTTTVKDMNNFLAGKPEQQLFDPFTFVCVLCKSWKAEAEKDYVEVNGSGYNVCERCRNTINDDHLAKPTGDFISRFERGQELVDDKEEVGPPEDEAGRFVIVINAQVWKAMNLETRYMAVDERLIECNSQTDKWGRVRLLLRKPDIQLHSPILERHGAGLRDDLRRMEAALNNHKAKAAQLKFNMESGLKGSPGEEELPPAVPDAWSPNLSYDLGAECQGSDGSLYRSASENNLGFDPVENSTYWRLANTEKAQAVDENEAPANTEVEKTVLTVVDGSTQKKASRPSRNGSSTQEGDEAA